MARPIPFNRNGFYGLETVGAPVITATEVTFNFEDHPFVNSPYNGDVTIRISSPIPTGTTATLPIYFKSGNRSSRAVLKVGDVPLTVADIPGVGYYKFFYDFNKGIVELYA